MAADISNNHSSGLTQSSIGQQGTRTRVRSLGSPALNKLREELKASSPQYKKKEITLREILDRMDSGET
jgi:hypothetical protein